MPVIRHPEFLPLYIRKKLDSKRVCLAFSRTQLSQIVLNKADGRIENTRNAGIQVEEIRFFLLKKY